MGWVYSQGILCGSVSGSESAYDLALVGRIQQGDDAAFGELINRHKAVAFSLACSILKDEALAEDALQDAFVRVYIHLGKFKQTSSFATWLYRIVVNVCYDRRQRESRQATWGDNYEGLDAWKDATVHHDGVQAERTHYINLILDRMKPDESLVLRLYYLAELTVGEVRTVTGFSAAKVKVTLYRARKSMEAGLVQCMGKELKDIL